jgi:AraC-like DNA-binding protein
LFIHSDTMDGYFKYLTRNPADEQWGLYLTVAGTAQIFPGEQYPPQGHPTGYHFTWEDGRVLHEYQINYITEGEGILETRDHEYPIQEGSILLIKPNNWHRYKPVSEKGWKEHYIGFDGNYARQLFQNDFYVDCPPVLNIGFHEKLMQSFQDILTAVKEERPSYQQVSSGLILFMLGTLLSLKKNEDLITRGIEEKISKACLYIRENLSSNFRIEELARHVDCSYSLFRQSFKKYTGLSPLQYHLSLRVQQSIYLLTNTRMSIKEISFSLGFYSVFYFSKLIKEKTGKNPSEYIRHRK